MQPIFKKYLATIAIIWAICFIVLLLAYLFIIVPQQQEVAAVKERLTVKEWEFRQALAADSNETRTRLKNDLASLGGEFNKYAANISDISKLGFDIGQAANDLQVMAFSCKGKTDENANNTMNTDHLMVMPVNLAFQGTFTQFAKFVNMLERHHPILFIDRFSIAHSATSDMDNQANLVLSVYLSKFQLSKAPVSPSVMVVAEDANEPNKPGEPNKPVPRMPAPQPFEANKPAPHGAVQGQENPNVQ